MGVRRARKCFRIKWLQGWACSSAGRASALQAGGRRFDPGHVHQPSARKQSLVNLALARFPQIDSIRSNKKRFHSFNRSAPLRWNRAQINLWLDLRRRATKQRLDVAKE